MSTNPVTLLHNFFAKNGQAHLVTYVESQIGPNNSPTWTVQCKISGEVKGVGVAGQKSTARQVAAQKALDSITGV